MAGLRERSKLRRREAIMSVAERLFRERGYNPTTIEDIARAAEVSVGTLYTYFGSKGGVLAGLMQPMMEEMQQKAARIIANPPTRTVDAVAAMYEAYRFTDEWKSLNIMAAFGPESKDHDSALEGIRATFEVFISRQMRELLEVLVAKKRLPETIDLDDAVFILFQFLMAHFNAYVRARGAMAYEELIVALHRRLRVLFNLGS